MNFLKKVPKNLLGLLRRNTHVIPVNRLSFNLLFFSGSHECFYLGMFKMYKFEIFGGLKNFNEISLHGRFISSD